MPMHMSHDMIRPNNTDTDSAAAQGNSTLDIVSQAGYRCHKMLEQLLTHGAKVKGPDVRVLKDVS